MDQNLEAPPGMGGPPAHHGQDSASPVIWLAAPCQGRGWGLRYHVVTHGDKAGAEIIRVHHACLLLWGQGHQDTRRRKGRPRARKTGHRWPEGRSRCTVLGSGGRGGQEGERNTGGRDAKTHPGKISTGRRKTEQRDAKSVHGMESDEERRRWAPCRFPRKITEGRGQGRSSGRRSPPGARRGQQKTSPAAHRKREARRSRQREREKRKKEKRVISRPGRHP